MSLPERVHNILDTIGEAAAEVPCVIEDYREFVSVTKWHASAITLFAERFPYLVGNEWIYTLQRFRVRAEEIEKEYDVVPQDCADYQTIEVADEKLLVAILSLWLGDLELLGRPVDCAIP